MPHILLKAKLANLKALPQEARQDARHVVLMIACTRLSLIDLANEAREKRITQRDAVRSFSTVRKLITRKENRELDQLHRLQLGTAIPASSEIPGFLLGSPLSNFYERGRAR